MYANQCSRVILADSPLKTELAGVLKGRKFGASRGQARLDNRYTKQGQPIGCDLSYSQMLTPLIGVSLRKHDIRIQPVRAVIVRGAPFCTSVTSRGNSTEHQHDRQNTRRSAVHREVRPSTPLPARSPRRVRAQWREQNAFKTRFHIAKLSIN